MSTLSRAPSGAKRRRGTASKGATTTTTGELQQQPMAKRSRASPSSSSPSKPAGGGSVDVITALFATAKKSFTCQICLKKFVTNDDIQRHFHSVHKEKAMKIFPGFVDKVFRCYRCPKAKRGDDASSSFKDEGSLKSHLRERHDGGRPEKGPVRLFPPFFPPHNCEADNLLWAVHCQRCDRTFADRRSLLDHVKSEHLGLGFAAFHCDHCKTGHATKQSWDRHLAANHRSYEDEDLYDYGGERKEMEAIQTFRLEGDRIVQLSSAYMNKETLPQQQQQKKRTRSSAQPNGYAGVQQHQQAMAMDLTQQQQQQQQRQQTVYRCPICDHVEVQEASLSAHIRRAHIVGQYDQQQQQYAPVTVNNYCDLCNIVFGSEVELAQHLQLHRQLVQQQQRFSCAFCGSVFHSNAELSSHQQLVHHFYGTQVDNKDDVLRIMQMKSGGNSNFQQQQQQFTTTTTNHHQVPPPPPVASQQQQEQQEVQLYQCSVCGFQTPQMTVLLGHMKKSHGVVTRLKCPMCNNTYTEQRGLKRHFSKNHVGHSYELVAATEEESVPGTSGGSGRLQQQYY